MAQRPAEATAPVAAEPVPATFLPPRAQLRDSIAPYIRSLILSGKLAPGSLIRLRSIAEALDVSITPVREALLLLADQRWVVAEPNRGFRVARRSRRDFEDRALVARLIAGELAARAAPRITPDQLDRLRAVVDQMASAPDNRESSARASDEFYAVIWGAAESRELAGLLESTYRPTTSATQATVPGWIEVRAASFPSVVEGLASGNPEVARAAMVEHLKLVIVPTLTHLEALGLLDSAEFHGGEPAAAS
jgi:DNA-binding GntR family transcriptional regulator